MDFSKKIFLTFDVDWAIDEVLEDICNILEKYQVSSTFFVTHTSPFIEKLKSFRNIELGIHPNFNPLLYGTEQTNVANIIQGLLDIVPNAVSYRSHCLTNSTAISLSLKKQIRYDLNYYISLSGKMHLSPFINPFGKIAVPFFFADDIAFSIEGFRKIDYYLNSVDSIKVFAFHPIHVFLNTENQERYADAKLCYKDFEGLIKHVNRAHFGTRDFFLQLLEIGSVEGFTFHMIKEIECD